MSCHAALLRRRSKVTPSSTRRPYRQCGTSPSHLIGVNWLTARLRLVKIQFFRPDGRDRLLELCEVIAEDRRKRLEIVAQSPARFVIVEGNVIAELIGPQRFERYHAPYIEQACELLHRHGKYAGAHLDANNNLLAEAVAKTSLDLIESFTPPPDCNLPLGLARRLWPEKTIQINFPSSVHLQGPQAVRRTALEILKDAQPGDRFIVGVSENIGGYGPGLDTQGCLEG